MSILEAGSTGAQVTAKKTTVRCSCHAKPNKHREESTIVDRDSKERAPELSLFLSLFLRIPKNTIPYAATFNPERTQPQPFALAPPIPFSLSICSSFKVAIYRKMYGEGESEEKSWWR